MERCKLSLESHVPLDHKVYTAMLHTPDARNNNELSVDACANEAAITHQVSAHACGCKC